MVDKVVQADCPVSSKVSLMVGVVSGLGLSILKWSVYCKVT